MKIGKPGILRKEIYRLSASVFAAACLVLSGCQSMQQDLLLESADEKTYRELDGIEEAVVRMDGAGADREGLAGARLQIAALEGTVADIDFEALLAAWSGRLFFMEGRNSDAQREYRKSAELSPRNIPVQILGFRMERNTSRRLALIDESMAVENAPGEILAERGRTLFDLGRFSEAVAAFDAAFILLEDKPFYAEAYGLFRDKAWELRELEQGAINRTREIAGQGEITWRDLIEITKNETDLLRFITAGRDWPAETLFNHLVDRSFIPYTQDATLTEWPFSKPLSSEQVLRSGAAWFLWYLNAENKANRGLLTRYSSRFANTPNAKSPIPDLDIRSPFIDPVLGCVESEFMSLPDGRNFIPREKVKGADFLSMLKKLTP